MSNAGDPPDDGADGSGNVLPFTGASHRPEFRVDADASLSLGALLAGDDETILQRLRLEPAGPERAFTRLVDGSSDRPPELASIGLDALRASHAAAPCYVVNIVQRNTWAEVPAGKSLLVAPAAKLRPLGLCIAAFNDDRPPGLCVFIAGREWDGKRLWLFAGSEMHMETPNGILALHPVIGSIEEPRNFDDDWVDLAAELLTMRESPWSGVNPTWRP